MMLRMEWDEGQSIIVDQPRAREDLPGRPNIDRLAVSGICQDLWRTVPKATCNTMQLLFGRVEMLGTGCI